MAESELFAVRNRLSLIAHREIDDRVMAPGEAEAILEALEELESERDIAVAALEVIENVVYRARPAPVAE